MNGPYANWSKLRSQIRKKGKNKLQTLPGGGSLTNVLELGLATRVPAALSIL